MDIKSRKIRRGEINEKAHRLKAMKLTLVNQEYINIKYGGEIGNGYYKVILEISATESELTIAIKMHIGDYEFIGTTWNKVINYYILPFLTY